MIERDLYRLDLLRKCRSADALPLEELVARANGAAAKAITGYHAYLTGRLREIEITARRRAASWGPESWATFGLAIYDVKSSAAMAGETFVFDYAQLLEMVLWRGDRSDPQLDIVIRLFLTAIAVAADRSFAAAELGNLRGALVQISERLSGPDPIKTGPRALHS